jgi:hypothetical protein
LSARAKRLLRYMPKVAPGDDAGNGENYVNFAYKA